MSFLIENYCLIVLLQLHLEKKIFYCISHNILFNQPNFYLLIRLN